MKKRLIFALVAFGIVMVYFVISLCIAFVNYKNNTKVWDELNYKGLIYNQHNYDDIAFGVGDMSKNGCGASAIYNILRLDGKYVALPEIIKKLDINGENFMGLLGTHPYAIKSVLSQYGYKVKYHFNSDNFEEKAKNSRHSIFVYIKKNGGHYQLMTDYNEESNEFQLYNSTKRSDMQSLIENNDKAIKFLITVNKK